MTAVDVIVIGAGPNGLAAAVTMARAGLRVRVYEAGPSAGGGARTAELTLPGFRHDICSAVHPLAFASGFFRAFGLEKRVRFITPEASFGQPTAARCAAVAYRDIERTVESLGADGPAWRSLIGPLADNADKVARITGSSLLRFTRHPVTLARFGVRALEQGMPTWDLRFSGQEAPALFTGVAAHSITRLPNVGAAATALALIAYSHARGWPVPVGGSQSIIDELVRDLLAHDGEIFTDCPVNTLDELQPTRAVLLDVTPRALARMGESRLPASYLRSLRAFRYGNAVAKVDFALSDPVPWAAESLRNVATVHLGGTRAQVMEAEAQVAGGRHAPRPYVLASEPTLLDTSRAPEGRHLLWAYAHVPRYSNVDQTETVTDQIERFAPGFRDTILAVAARTGREMEDYNQNYVGGDIAAGTPSLIQTIRRPVLSSDPWRTPAPGIYLCSASTPPGPGVHGLAGWYAARSALRHEFAIDSMPPLGPEGDARP